MRTIYIPEDDDELAMLYITTPPSDGMRDIYLSALTRRVSSYTPPGSRLLAVEKLTKKARKVLKLLS